MLLLAKALHCIRVGGGNFFLQRWRWGGGGDGEDVLRVIRMVNNFGGREGAV